MEKYANESNKLNLNMIIVPSQPIDFDETRNQKIIKLTQYLLLEYKIDQY